MQLPLAAQSPTLATQLRVLSSQPLILEALDFTSAEDCAALITLARLHGTTTPPGASEELQKQVFSLVRLAPSSTKVDGGPTSVGKLGVTQDDLLIRDAFGDSPSDNDVERCAEIEQVLQRGRRALDTAMRFVEEVLDLPTHPRETDSPVVHFTPAPKASLSGEHLPRSFDLGLHLDTNHRPMRCATAILYLSTLPDECDGATVFPCAATCERDDKFVHAELQEEAWKLARGGAASRAEPDFGDPLPLTPEKAARDAPCGSDFTEVPLPLFQHTSAAVRAALRSDEEGEGGGERDGIVVQKRDDCKEACRAATRLLNSGETGSGISVSPVAGKLVIFFSRGPNGCVDPLSFHGGANVLPPRLQPFVPQDGNPTWRSVGPQPFGKWTLQLFREAPLDFAADDSVVGGDSTQPSTLRRLPRSAVARLRAAMSGSGPLVRVAEESARAGAVRMRAAALKRVGRSEALLR